SAKYSCSTYPCCASFRASIAADRRGLCVRRRPVAPALEGVQGVVVAAGGRHEQAQCARQRGHQPEQEKTAAVHLLPAKVYGAENGNVQRVDQRKDGGAGGRRDQKRRPQYAHGCTPFHDASPATWS